MHRCLAHIAAVSIALVFPASGVAQPTVETGGRDARAVGGAESSSVSAGIASRGRLRDAVALGDSETLVVKADSDSTRWGTAELVATVERAAAEVARQFPGARMLVGDLSRPRGGRAGPHRSHRSGRDVDIGFYLTDDAGAAVTARSFVRIDGRGAGRDRRGGSYRFDTPRNWALVEALLTDPNARVQFMLLSYRIRQLLLEHARRSGASADVLSRFEIVSTMRRGSAGHDSHLHVRVYCSADDRPECVDAPPLHPWLFPDQAEVTELTARWRAAEPRRRRAPARSRHSHRTRRQRH